MWSLINVFDLPQCLCVHHSDVIKNILNATLNHSCENMVTYCM